MKTHPGTFWLLKRDDKTLVVVSDFKVSSSDYVPATPGTSLLIIVSFYKLCYLYSCEIVSLHRDFAYDWLIECCFKKKSKTYKLSEAHPERCPQILWPKNETDLRKPFPVWNTPTLNCHLCISITGSTSFSFDDGLYICFPLYIWSFGYKLDTALTVVGHLNDIKFL